MTIEITIPQLSESIQEVQILKWLKKEGERIRQDEILCELETDKASVELPAPASGVVFEILKKEGEIVAIGETIGHLKEMEVEAADGGDSGTDDAAAKPNEEKPASRDTNGGEPVHATPSARRALRENDLAAKDVKPGGGRLRREDVEAYVQQKHGAAGAKQQQASEGELEEVVPMSLLRKRISERLVEAQQTAALLTTFNEIDMSEVMELRKKYRDEFIEKFDIKLGFMSFFVKGVIDALKQFPQLNAEIRGTDIVYRDYYHIGVAIGGGRGLVVPVLRHAERMSFADIELQIADFATRARENKIRPEELSGGTFTITNGGVYGSLLSTPIVNPPQSGVLGMHSIQERPVAREGQVVIRPMMYVALTYDHRIVDGREAVTFLKRLCESIEDPSRMLMEV